MHGTGGGAEPASHLRAVFAPGVPTDARAVLDPGDQEPNLAGAYWVTGIAVACILVGIALLRSAVTGDGHALAGWLILLVVPVLLTVAATRAARAGGRSQELRGRYADRYIPAAELAAVAARFPPVDARLRRLDRAIGRLEASEAYSAGWLPGLDERHLETVRWGITKDLLATAPLRDALARAAERGRLAEQVAQRRADLAARDGAVDAGLDQLDALVAAAARVDELLEDLRVAEELDALDPLAVEARLRQQLPASGRSVAELAAGADAVEELLRSQLASAADSGTDSAAGAAGEMRAVHPDPTVRSDPPDSVARLGRAEGLA